MAGLDVDTEMSIDDTPVEVRPGRTSMRLDEVVTISFEQDFENLGRLGSGSFADVFKARSKLDGSVYAVGERPFGYRVGRRSVMKN